MKKAEVEIGVVYVVKVSGVLRDVRITRESEYGGWVGVNLATGRKIRIRGAQRIRRKKDVFAHRDGTAHSTDGPLGCFPCANLRRQQNEE
jgi:hypothetical protein